MKRKFLAIAVLTVFLAACTKTDVPEKTGAADLNPSASKKIAPAPINFTAPFLFPEGMVYDPFTDRFLVSSIALGTIGAVTKDGVYSPFIQDPDLASTAGMEIDKARKRLLVTNARVDGSLAQLAIYNLNTQTRLFLVDLAAVANDGAPHLANDVALDQQGNAYVTDSYAGIIYKVDLNGMATVFYQNPAFTPAPGGFGFNGIEYSNANQGYLLVLIQLKTRS
jgi:sugar lactone lactonase YvrE